jgi:tetratricopeptide (TPR) repeat protein
VSTAVTQPPRKRAWIVSPAWDLAYVVLTPLAIVPAVLVAARRWLEPEQIYLAVIAFASLGHHLPGFMRAYGDRELFARYRRRFLLAPPLVFGLALLFTPPTRVASTLGLPWTHLHGLELILLIWGTWHGLMQTYGFMRIYDLRAGENDRWSATLDHALCVVMFTAGVVFSDTRMFGVAGAMWQSGLPLFGAAALASARWVVGVVSGVVVVLYAVNLIARRQHGVPINWIKLLLATATGWFYWYCGRLSTNVLVGIAMFEIYHAVQYNAIVWIYNRRLFERAGERFGPLGFLFRDRTTMLGLYLAMIAAYASIRFFTSHAGDRMFGSDIHDARQWLIALFVTSSFLHFYYDGFIWKVSERKTRENLTDEAASLPVVDQFVPGMVHFGKWAVLLAIVGVLLAAERRYQGLETAERERADRRMLHALAALTPEVPEAQRISAELAAAEADEHYLSGLDALKRADAAAAVEPLRKAVSLDPSHYRAQLQLGDALIAIGEYDLAAAAFRRAIGLRSEAPEGRIGLADAQIKTGHVEEALETLREGLIEQPDSPELNFTLGLLLQQTGEHDEAARRLRRAAELGLSP